MVFLQFESWDSGIGLPAVVYGVLHGLAWNFPFAFALEAKLWRVSAICTAGSGLLISCLSTVRSSIFGSLPNTAIGALRMIGFVMNTTVTVVTLLAAFARIFLVLESFIAVPDSPGSAYEVPRWSAYLPHFG